MRYQIRLINENLPGLARRMAKDCWGAADEALKTPPSAWLYRAAYKALRESFREHVKAYRYCGACRGCEQSLPKEEQDRAPVHEAFPGEKVQVLFTEEDTPPGHLLDDLVRRAQRAAIPYVPARVLKEVGADFRKRIDRSLGRRIFRSEACGNTELCHMNEPYDPWDMREPVNRPRAASGS